MGLEDLTVFSPETSHYHWVMEKTYGTELAKQLLGFSTPKRERKPKTCLMCKQPFYTRSQKKIYCGKQDRSGTCSYEFKHRKRKSIWEKKPVLA